MCRAEYFFAGRGKGKNLRGESENLRGGAKKRVNPLIQKFDKSALIIIQGFEKYSGDFL